jgi:hypothetical protein
MLLYPHASRQGRGLLYYVASKMQHLVELHVDVRRGVARRHYAKLVTPSRPARLGHLGCGLPAAAS